MCTTRFPRAEPARLFNELGPAGHVAPAKHDIDLVLDIPVQLTVELGRTKIAIRNLLQLAQGSVVELEGMAGEPMDVLVNGCLIAQGEVVVVKDKFGVRLIGARPDAIAVAEADPELTVALISKVYPMRSHTVAAEGGAAAQENAGEVGVDGFLPLFDVQFTDWRKMSDARIGYQQINAAEPCNSGFNRLDLPEILPDIAYKPRNT